MPLHIVSKCVFPTSAHSSKCLFLCPDCHRACGDLLLLKQRNFPGSSVGRALSLNCLRESSSCVSAVPILHRTHWHPMCVHTSCAGGKYCLMQRAGGVDVAIAGDRYQQSGCGRPDNRHLIHFSIQFGGPWCMMMDRNKLMICK